MTNFRTEPEPDPAAIWRRGRRLMNLPCDELADVTDAGGPAAVRRGGMLVGGKDTPGRRDDAVAPNDVQDRG